MNICMLLAVFRSRTTVPETFTSNASWTAPVTTSRIDSLVGSGAAGVPGTSETTIYYERYQQTTYQYAEGYGTNYQTEWEYVDTTYGSAPPSDFCSNLILQNGNEQRTICYRFVSGEDTTETPPTTGASSTGFGKTFVGGTGGAATPVTHNNVAVTPGATYSLVVPAGGSISITYTR